MTTTALSDAVEQRMPGPGFIAGLIAGGMIATLVALAMAARASPELRQGMAAAASNLGNAVSEPC